MQLPCRNGWKFSFANQLEADVTAARRGQFLITCGNSLASLARGRRGNSARFRGKRASTLLARRQLKE